MLEGEEKKPGRKKTELNVRENNKTCNVFVCGFKKLQVYQD
jgi:hypothetical protein